MNLFCFTKGDQDEIFHEKRRLFQFSGRVDFSASAGSDKPKKRPKAKKKPDILGELRALREQVSAQRKALERRETSGTHSTRAETRRATPAKRVDPKAAAKIEKLMKREGLMSLEEIDAMESAHVVLSTHYVDPAFMLSMNALKKLNPTKAKEVYDTMNAILANPYGYYYKYDARSDSTLISRREEKKYAKLPKVSMKIMKGGLIEEINGKSLKIAGKLPWDNQNYQQRVKDFEKQTQSSIAPSIRTSPSARQRLEQLGSELKENFVLVNTLVPYNIIRLIEARDYEFEKGDGRVKKLLKEKANLERLANLSWEDAYNEMVHNNNYRVSVTTESGVPDAYRLNFAGEELWVHKSGFIITRNSQGKYEPLAEYGTHLTEQYFDQNPNAATELLQDAQGPGVQQKIDVAKEKKEKLDHQALIDQMEPALGDADWDTLKAVAKSIQDPNNLAALESQLETMEKKVQDSPDDKKKEVLEAHEELLLNAIIKPIKGDHEIAKKAFAVKELKPYLENLKRINRLDKEMSGMSWTELKELAVHLAYPENKVAIKEHYDKIEGGFKGDTDAEQQAKTELIDAWTKAMHKDPKLIDAGEQKLNLPPI